MIKMLVFSISFKVGINEITKIRRMVFLYPQSLSRENLHKPLFFPLFQHGICLVSFSSGAILFMTKAIAPLLPAYNSHCLPLLFGTWQYIPSGTTIWLFKTWMNCLPRKVMKILKALYSL